MTPTAVDDPSARETYERWHDRFAVDVEADTPWHRLVKTHLDWSRDIAGRDVLEIGSGRGGFACWLAARPSPPRNLVAADFAESAVSKGREFSRQTGLSIHWEVADIARLPHRTSQFDTVISCETLEHCPDPRRALKELQRVLRPGGRLLLTTPNYLAPMGLYRIYLRLRGRRFTEEGQPINHPMLLPRTLKWARDAGLLVQSAESVGHYIPFPGAPPREWRRLERPRMFLKWVGLHSIVVGLKPVTDDGAK